MWFTVDWHKHPKAKTSTLLEIENEIWQKTFDQGALFARGSWFVGNRDNFEHTEMFFRCTYAAASEENMIEAIRRFSIAIKTSFGLE